MQVSVGDIGEIYKVRIGHDNSGSFPAWRPKQVRVSGLHVVSDQVRVYFLHAVNDPSRCVFTTYMWVASQAGALLYVSLQTGFLY